MKKLNLDSNFISRAFTGKHKDFSITAVICVVIALAPIFLSNDYLIHIGCLIGINILIALGMHVVTGLAGQINMGQYGFYCIGAYTYAITTTQFGFGFLTALLCSILVSAVFGALLGIPSLKVEGPYLSLCTIGFAESVRLVLNSAGWAGKANGIMRIPKLSFFGITMATKTQSYFFIMAIAVLGIIIVNNLMRSNFGRKFTAVKDDPLAASVMGINVTKTKLLAFSICAIFGGIAGSLYAGYVSYITPTIFIQALQTNFLLMIVLGGLGSSWGAIVGASLVTIVFEYTRAYAQYQKIVFGIVMILIVLFLKRGIIGTIKNYKNQKLIRNQHHKIPEEAS